MDISDNYFFSETEKIDEIIDETSEQNLEGIEDLEEPNLDEIGLMEERCSGLWNQIKDANVLNGSEFSKLSMSKLKLDADLLSREVQWFSVRFPTFSTNIQLRLDCVYQALSELQHKKENEKTFEEEEGQEENNSSNSVMASKFRKWLCRQELDLARIRQKIPFSRNSLSSLQDLELEQKYLQEQIQKEGRKLLCRLNIQRSTSTDRKLFDTLEQRYLALWLASLESFELIVQFKKRLFAEDKEDLSSELEEGPDPKRRKTFEKKIEEKIFENLPITTDLSLNQSNDLLATKATFVMDGVRHERQQPLPLGSDIGYSSGENNSVHEIISNAKSLGEDYREQYKENDVDPPLWAEQIAQSNELEKSFYRTVPLDDYGMTDLDTDEGGFGQEGGKYLTQKILQDFEEKIGQGKLELTDSLIVHVDSPENRPLNEFEEVMDLFGKDKIFVNSGRPFSEDDCESLSTFTENERERRKINNRKRSFKPPLLLNKNEVKQKIQNNRRRKCASDARCRNLSAYNGFLSNDFEWDDDAFIGYQNISVENSFDKLPDILLDGDFNETKKAFSSFYDKFRQVLSESQNLNERLRELITFVDKSFDGTSVLFQELNSTFTSVSNLCNDERFDENGFNFSKSINSNLILLQQRINSLETTCENLSLILLGKQYLIETSNNKDYTNKFAREFNEIKEELKKLKNRFGNHFFNSFVVNIAQNNVTTSFENSPSNKSPPTLFNSSTQSSFLTKSEHPTIPSSFWRSYLLMCLIGLFTSFAILLYMNRRDGVDFRWSFGPQLHYQNGRPPI